MIERDLIATDLVVVVREPLGDFLTQHRPLLEQHWRELAAYPDIPLDLDEAFYGGAEQAGQLVLITMRVASRLCGYAVFLLRPHPHYRTSLQALEDVIYVAPSARRLGLGRKLVRESERILRALGCQVVHHAIKLAHPALGVLLEDEGYQAIERTYSKRLD